MTFISKLVDMQFATSAHVRREWIKLCYISTELYFPTGSFVQSSHGAVRNLTDLYEIG